MSVADDSTDTRAGRAGRLIGAILVAAAALRLWNLGGPSLWADEGLTVMLVRLPFAEMLAQVKDWEQTPPALHLMLWGWVRCFGDSEFSLRLPSVALGVWGVWSVWRLGVENVGVRAGLVAAALVALNGFHIYHSREARAYSLFFTAGVASWVYLLRAMRGEGGAGAQAGWVAASVVMIYAHVYGGFAMAGACLVYIPARWSGRAPGLGVRRWLTLSGAVAASFTPWFKVVLFDWTWVVTSGMFWIEDKGLWMIGRTVVTFWGSWVGAMVASAVAAAGVWLLRGRVAGWLAVAVFAAVLVVPVLISMWWTPVFWPRYAILALGAMTILAGGAAGVRAWTAWAAVGLGAVSLGVGWWTAPPPTDWRTAARDLSRDVRPGDLVVNAQSYTHIVFGYYWDRTDITRLRSSFPVLPPQAESANRVWLTLHEARFTLDEVERDNPGWKVVERRVYDGVAVVRLGRAGDRTGP